MPSSIISPFPVFNDLDGSPLENGYIYIGQSNLNPETAPVNVFWDAARTIPAAQPIRTIGGFPSRNGSPSNVYVEADTYSITVRNSRRVFVYSAFDQSDAPSSVFDISTQVITATAGQTTFTLTTFTYLPGTDTLQVYRNGLRLTSVTDYIETNSSTVTLTSPAALGDQFLFQGGAVITGDQVPGTGVSFIQAGTGAITRNMQDKARESVSVLDFGADPTGVTDSTLQIQAAIDSIPAHPLGGSVYLPTGTYKVSAPILVNKSVYFYGDGYGTNIQTSSATANVLVASAERFHVSNLRITSSVTRTAGWYIDVLAGGNRSRISNFEMDGAFGGIRTNATASLTIENGQLFNGTPSTGVAIKVENGLDLTIRDILTDSATNIFAGIYIKNAGDVAIEDSQLLHAGQALYIECGSGEGALSIWANNTFFDTSDRGLYMLASNGGNIARCLFDQCWFAASVNQNILMATATGGLINGIDFNGCHIFLAGADGVLISDSGCSNIKFHDCSVSQNTLSGIKLGSNVSNVSIQDSIVGSGYGLLGNTDGVTVSAGTGGNLQICNNKLTGNTSSNFNNASTAITNVIFGNIGATELINYTPVVAAQSGTITTLGSLIGRYQRIGKTLFIKIGVPITTNGTGSVAVKAYLPPGMLAATDCVIAGRENNLTGNMLQGSIITGSDIISITKYDNTYPGGNGYLLTVNGTIEIQ